MSDSTASVVRDGEFNCRQSIIAAYLSADGIEERAWDHEGWIAAPPRHLPTAD